MEKTGIRNGKLFCFNCGGSYDINLPQRVSMSAAMMKQFSKDHKNCKPTWKEPEAEPNSIIQKRMNFWLTEGERGTSSETMFEKISGHMLGCGMSHPRDPDDFKRCYKLLQLIPEWKAELYKLKELSLVWEKLVDNWDKLTEMLEEQLQTRKPNGMYEFMNTLGC